MSRSETENRRDKMTSKNTRKNVFPANEVDTNQPGGWIVDLNDPNERTINPDCYWRFSSRRKANQFAALVESGVDPHEALAEMDRNG
jgi:hypothetical protein